MSDDEVILICMRAGEGGEIVTGSTLARCSQCDREVWIAPTGRKVVESKNASIHCPECGFAAIGAAEEATFKVAPGQVEELGRHFRGD